MEKGSAARLSAGNFSSINSLMPHIRYIAWDRYDSPWHLEERTMYDHEFILIRGGEGEFRIDDRVYNVHPGDLLLMQPETMNSGRSVRLPLQFICIHFDLYSSKDNLNLGYNRRLEASEFPKMNLETFVRDKLEYEKTYLDYPELTSVRNADILRGFERIFYESYHSQPGWNTICSTAFLEILTLLSREVSPSPQGSEAALNPAIEDAAAYIRDNIGGPVSIPELAQRCHLSTDYFSRLFKKQMGVTPQQFILYCRMAHARYLLCSGGAKLEWVAKQCGYEDIHYFSRLFKQVEGMSPTEYRETLRREDLSN